MSHQWIILGRKGLTNASHINAHLTLAKIVGNELTSVSKYVVNKTVHKNEVVRLATVPTVVNSSPGFSADCGPGKTNNLH